VEEEEEDIVIDRAILKEVRCLSWDEGNEVESMQVRKRTYSERWGGIGPVEKKSFLTMLRELLEEDLEDLWPFE
jgi:hypothetical protein